MKRILWTEWGPEIKYDGKILYVEDINPHRVMKWKLSRREVFKMGMALVFGSIFTGRK